MAAREEEPQERILKAALKLLTAEGIEAVTTRAVAAAADVQAPTIYRAFGDKDGLLDAVAQFALERYVAQKKERKPSADPVEDLRSGWDENVQFNLAHPGLFSVMSARTSPAVEAGLEVLKKKLERVAAAGLLKVPVDRAVALMASTGRGVVQQLLRKPDPALAELAREAVIDALIGKKNTAQKTGVVGAAVALRASLRETEVLTAGELGLLHELLDRIAQKRS